MQLSKAGHPSFILNSSHLAPAHPSLFNSTKYDLYARPPMLKNTCGTSLVKMGVGAV
jgi:hypothetical protein